MKSLQQSFLLQLQQTGAEMRSKQTAYFTTRSNDVLREAKQLERQYDQLQRDYHEAEKRGFKPLPEQQRLF